MIKMIVSDLDGTLLTEHREILSKDKESILNAKKNGIDISIASGRMDVEINEVFNIMGVKGHRISQNGAFVYSKDGQRIYGNPFSTENVINIYGFLTTHVKERVTLYSENTGFVSNSSQLRSEDEHRLFFPIKVEPDLLKMVENGLEVSKISVYSQNTDSLKEIQKQVEEAFSNVADSFISDPSCLDIMPKNINKGKGIEAIMNALNIAPEEMICIGDSFNDISMFNLTPHSYVMSQSEDTVKQYAAHEINYVHEALEDILK
ncbi:hypothetical protein SAMN05421676_10317 [Salinibacillus kushneri]|uniref:Cof subfamily of IIB subfamily of haloacid dehalogenase superfamily/HAD-superfamily hydrolase, subfamily IIB n=1 Tax=Salinibacillus kushneri TaxID=237682 RepID=A0A1I0C3K4_9BACI|nr:HAD family hydrolase [Salinibacillus kushneri]SET13890.1 hypothetical protein SAMN05421676_10317 [Salinibacillus kushneri]